MPELPYRTHAEAAPSPAPPREYIYVAHERDLNAAFHRVWIRTWLFGFGFGGCIGAAGSPGAAWVVIVGVLAWSIWSWRRTRRGDAIVFRVEEGRLSVTRRGHAPPLVADLPLTELRDVALDTRSILPVMRDTSIATVASETKVRGEVDIARIVVVPNGPDGRGVALTEERLAHMDAVEGAGKIRTFLRAHGWIPEDEREGAAVP